RPSGQTYQLPGIPRHASPAAPQEGHQRRRRKSEKKDDFSITTHNVDGHMMAGDIDLVGFDVLMKTKIAGATAMGRAISLWPPHDAPRMFLPRLNVHLTSPFSSPQMVSAIVMEEYCKLCTESSPLKTSFQENLLNQLNADRPVMYRDLHSYMQIVWSQCHSLLNTFRDSGKIASPKLPRI